MGIENLWDVLKEYECGEKVHLEELARKIKTDRCCIAIDAYVMYHKFFCIAWGFMIMRTDFSYNNVVNDVIKMINNMSNNLSKHGISQLWCSDGDKSADKLATNKRTLIRNSRIAKIAKLHRDCIRYAERNPLEGETYLEILSRYDFLRDYWYLIQETPQRTSFPRPHEVVLPPRERSDEDSETSLPTETNSSPTRAAAANSDDEEVEHMPEEVERAPEESFNISICVGLLKNELMKNPIMAKNMTSIMRARLEELGHRFISIPEISEGEKLCVIAVRLGLCQAVLSNDSDLIPLGARFIIKEINKDIASIYSYSEILNKMDITHEKLLSYCIMLGNDFNDGIPGMAKVKCLTEVRRPDFNIYDFDLSRGGLLRVNTCIRALSISREEEEMVKKEIMKQYS